MKVLVIDFYHSTTNVGGLRWKKFVKYLEGVEPIILTYGYPDMDDDNVFHVPFLFSFKASHGFAYGRDDSLWGKAMRFLRGNLFIPDPRRLWFAYTLAKELIVRYGIKTVITTGPPHSVHLIGLKLKRKLKVKWIADFRDPWIQYWHKDLYLTKHARNCHEHYYRKVLINADVILQVEDYIVDSMFVCHKYKYPITVSNGFDPDDYPGTVDAGRDFAYVGSLSDRALLPPVKYEHIQKLPHDEAIEKMRQAGYLLVAYPADVIPSKVYEYMASGRPIVSYGLRGKGAELIERTGTGWHFSNYETFYEFFGVTEVKSYQHPFVKLSWVITRYPQPKRNEKEIERYNVKNIAKTLSTIIKTINQ